MKPENILRELQDLVTEYPAGWFENRGITLKVWKDSERLPGMQVRAVWNPSVRTVEVFGCIETGRRDEIIGAMLHEMVHVICHLNTDDVSEEETDLIAAGFLSQIPDSDLDECFRQLCFMAESFPDSGITDSRTDNQGRWL